MELILKGGLKLLKDPEVITEIAEKQLYVYKRKNIYIFLNV